ncbi:MAG: type II secretion system protein [Planctomycetota bacterium]|jgi:prepilin-type N-terminal cleavage/methylation domain-containing protein|nr:type II secretion system protein [Planctomycetota bacterium]
MVARRGFTLIELLVTVAIMATLAGLVVAVIGIARVRVTAARSELIVGTVKLALTRRAAERGGRVRPAEHPLAGSAAPRLVFARDPGHGLAAPAIAGEALRALPASLASARERVLLDDDRFHGGNSLTDPVSTLPFLYGMPRGMIGVPRPSWNGVTHYRRLPRPGPLNSGGGVLIGPYDASRYSDRVCLVAPTASDIERLSAEYLQGVLGEQAAELAAIGALRSAIDNADTPLIAGDRLRHLSVGADNTPGTAGAWRAGMVRDGGTWKRYALRGTAVYDAWGHEILCGPSPSGGLSVMSAGADGVMRWHPGADGVYQTDVHASSAAGDDRPGAKDNIVHAADIEALLP